MQFMMQMQHKKAFSASQIVLGILAFGALMPGTMVNAAPLLGVDLGSLQLPDIKMPSIKIPDIKVPAIKLPEFKVPDIKVPELKVPDIKILDQEYPVTIADMMLLRNAEPGKVIDWVALKTKVLTKTLGIDNLLKYLNADIIESLNEKLPAIPGTILANPELLGDFKYMAEYAAASYCDYSAPRSPLAHAVSAIPLPLKCLDDYCPTLTDNGVSTYLRFDGKDISDTTGILTLDKVRKLIVLSFRGSKSLRNFFTDARILLTPVEEICANCTAHNGFMAASKTEVDGITAALRVLWGENPGFKVVTVGHSLGGAIATLTAGLLRNTGEFGNIDVYSFGAPRVGNDALNKYLSQTNMGNIYRITSMDDPIPRLPPVSIGYTHVEPEYHVFKREEGKEPSVEDVKVLPGTVNRLGNMFGEKGPLGFDIMAHGRYFVGQNGLGWLSGCGRGLFEF